MFVRRSPLRSGSDIPELKNYVALFKGISGPKDPVAQRKEKASYISEPIYYKAQFKGISGLLVSFQCKSPDMWVPMVQTWKTIMWACKGFRVRGFSVIAQVVPPSPSDCRLSASHRIRPPDQWSLFDRRIPQVLLIYCGAENNVKCGTKEFRVCCLIGGFMCWDQWSASMWFSASHWISLRRIQRPWFNDGYIVPPMPIFDEFHFSLTYLCVIAKGSFFKIISRFKALRRFIAKGPF